MVSWSRIPGPDSISPPYDSTVAKKQRDIPRSAPLLRGPTATTMPNPSRAERTDTELPIQYCRKLLVCRAEAQLPLLLRQHPGVRILHMHSWCWLARRWAAVGLRARVREF